MVSSLVPLTQKSYMYGINPYDHELVKITGSVELSRGGALRCRKDGWLFVCSELVVLNGLAIAEAIEKHVQLHGYGEMPTVHLSEGVAGSGKSTRIRQASRPEDLILTATTRCAEEMREKLSPGGKDAPTSYSYSEQMLNSRIRTLDAFTLHGSEQAATIRVDEAKLVHFGAVMAAAMKAGAKVVYLSGDGVQIPFLNRIDFMMKTHYASVNYFDHFEFWRVSFRLTHWATKAANKHYYKGLCRTTNTVADGVELIKIADASDPVVTSVCAKADLVMGFYKVEKSEVTKKSKCKDIRTVHEAQGADAPVAVLVKLNDLDSGGLYAGPKSGGRGHAFVGMSRNNKMLYILHKGADDFLCEYYRHGLEPQPQERYVFDPDVHDAVFMYF